MDLGAVMPPRNRNSSASSLLCGFRQIQVRLPLPPALHRYFLVSMIARVCSVLLTRSVKIAHPGSYGETKGPTDGTAAVGNHRRFVISLMVQDYAKEAAMDRQPAVILDKSQLPEPVHEMTDPRSGCANHLCEVCLTDLRLEATVMRRSGD